MQLIWFRHDLRIHDHEPLLRAMQSEEETIGLYIHDVRQDEEILPGIVRMGQYRRRFLAESLLELGESLKSLGISFVIKRGISSKEMSTVIHDYGVDQVLVHEHPGVWERRDLDHLMNIHPEVTWSLFDGHTLMRRKDLPMKASEFPMSFSKFRSKLEKRLKIPQKGSEYSSEDPLLFSEVKAPDHANFHNGSNPDFTLPDFMKSWLDGVENIVKGGESAGLERLENYVSVNGGLFSYKETRDGMLHFDDSSKLSFWLSNGSLSAKRVYQKIMEAESMHGRNISSYWLFFELLWREYFQWLMWSTNERLFLRKGFLNGELLWHEDQEAFLKWREGITGYPLVDAAMEELNRTGFMSNRARQNVASFLTKNLGIDWLLGAKYFEAMLIDFDPASNYGNWAYQAGVGTDARELRAFNVIGQGKRYDPSGAYARYWLGLSEEIPDHLIYDPEKIDVITDRPEPMVNLEVSLKKRREELDL